MGQDITQVCLRIKIVELGSFDQRVHCSCALAAAIGAGEKIVLPANGDTA